MSLVGDSTPLRQLPKIINKCEFRLVRLGSVVAFELPETLRHLERCSSIVKELSVVWSQGFPVTTGDSGGGMTTLAIFVLVF